MHVSKNLGVFERKKKGGGKEIFFCSERSHLAALLTTSKHIEIHEVNFFNRLQERVENITVLKKAHLKGCSSLL